MPSKTFEEILNKASDEDKAAINRTKALAPQGQEVAESPTTPTSIPGKTMNASPETGYNVDHLDAQTGVQKSNSPTMSEIGNKPVTTEKPTPTPEPEMDR